MKKIWVYQIRDDRYCGEDGWQHEYYVNREKAIRAMKSDVKSEFGKPFCRIKENADNFGIGITYKGENGVEYYDGEYVKSWFVHEAEVIE